MGFGVYLCLLNMTALQTMDEIQNKRNSSSGHRGLRTGADMPQHEPLTQTTYYNTNTLISSNRTTFFS